MNEFLVFVSNGAVETFESKFKEKLWYFLRTVYYSLALIFAIVSAHEIYLYFNIDSGISLLNVINDSFERSSLIPILSGVALSPLIFAFIGTLSAVRFSYIKVCTSFSLLLSTVLCFAIYQFRLLSAITNNSVLFIIFFWVATGVFFLISSNLLSNKNIARLGKFWNKHLSLITYSFVVIFAFVCLLLINADILNMVTISLSMLIFGLLILYVRRLLGLVWSIVLHYILLAPFVGILAYMISNNY